MSDRLLVDGVDVCPVEHAHSFADRSRGLLGRDSVHGALWLWRTVSVHTIGMRVAIDVVHCDGVGRVRSVRTMRPGRLGAPRWRARSVVELAAGSAARLGIVPGVVLSTDDGSSRQPGSPRSPGSPDRSALPSRSARTDGSGGWDGWSRRDRRRRTERAATVAEYVGVVALVAAVSTGLQFESVGGQLRHGLAAAVCVVLGRTGCDAGLFADGSLDPEDPSNLPPPRCVSHADAVDLDLEVGFARFAVVGGSGRMLREDRSDGTVAVAMVGDVLAGVGVGGEVGLRLGDVGEPAVASAQVDARFGSGATWVFASSAEADAFERWVASHPAGDPIAGLAVLGVERVATLMGLDAPMPPPPRRLDVHGGADVAAALEAIGAVDVSGLVGSIERIRSQISVRFGATAVLGVTIDLDDGTITAHVDGMLATEVFAGIVGAGAHPPSAEAVPEPGVGAGSMLDRSVGFVFDLDSRLRRLDIDGSAPVDEADAKRIGASRSLAELGSVLGAGDYGGRAPALLAQVHASLDLDDPTNRAALDAVIGELASGEGADHALGELAYRLNADGQVSATTASVSAETPFRLGVGIASVGADRSTQDLRDAYYLDRSRGGLVRWRACG